MLSVDDITDYFEIRNGWSLVRVYTSNFLLLIESEKFIALLSLM
ncbi:hypothetical protein SAMN04488089_1333 [Myroides profundi]|uniref:Uncharacterized protein n=1 Tax=Myroides profundi TaxID=480520 RepID=A0AAJ4W1B6_MYRPR|nr:hypothetical protein MPR_0403 [Myroides profundi]SEP91875.1 hypothetical protein SAMN04488089_10188 [Myroides profundi]SER70831.1 hypothetical protein SAMN04488089_1333 [Myroides profundi]